MACHSTVTGRKRKRTCANLSHSSQNALNVDEASTIEMPSTLAANFKEHFVTYEALLDRETELVAHMKQVVYVKGGIIPLKSNAEFRKREVAKNSHGVSAANKCLFSNTGNITLQEVGSSSQMNRQPRTKSVLNLRKWLKDLDSRLTKQIHILEKIDIPEHVFNEASREVNILKQSVMELDRKLQNIENCKKPRQQEGTVRGNVTTNEANSSAVQANHIKALLDSQFTCSICSEYFINPTLVQCQHKFCVHCLSMWMRESIHCPLCRSVIVSTMPLMYLDYTIWSMVQRLSVQEQLERAAVIQERANHIRRLCFENYHRAVNGF